MATDGIWVEIIRTSAAIIATGIVTGIVTGILPLWKEPLKLKINTKILKKLDRETLEAQESLRKAEEVLREAKEIEGALESIKNYSAAVKEALELSKKHQWALVDQIEIEMCEHHEGDVPRRIDVDEILNATPEEKTKQACEDHLKAVQVVLKLAEKAKENSRRFEEFWRENEEEEEIKEALKKILKRDYRKINEGYEKALGIIGKATLTGDEVEGTDSLRRGLDQECEAISRLAKETEKAWKKATMQVQEAEKIQVEAHNKFTLAKKSLERAEKALN